MAEANKGNECGLFEAIEVKQWGDTGYYLSLLQLTEKTRTGDRKMDG